MLRFIRHAFALIREDKLFSTIYIAGTAVAIASAMVVALVLHIRISNIYPEENRDRTVYVASYFKNDEGRFVGFLGYSSLAMEEVFSRLQCAEVVPYSKLLLRLKPVVDADDFVNRLTPTLTSDFRDGICMLGSLETYQQHYDKQVARDQWTMLSQLASIPLVLFAVIVVLGTLGTFWLQIRKRTEDIGIMRSFGAKRCHIFWMIWGEGAVLTALAWMVGCLVWFQFAISADLLSEGGAYGRSGRETDWVNSFGLHYLIICVIQYLLLLAIVTLGILVPMLIAMYKRPVEALRHE